MPKYEYYGGGRIVLKRQGEDFVPVYKQFYMGYDGYKVKDTNFERARRKISKYPRAIRTPLLLLWSILYQLYTRITGRREEYY